MSAFTTWGCSSDYASEQVAYKRLWDHMRRMAHEPGYTVSAVKDPDAYDFFMAVLCAFTPCEKMQGMVPVNQELLAYILAWGRHAARDGSPSIGGPETEHCLGRAFRGFVETLKHAVRLNQLRYFEDGRILYGCLEVPQWFIEKTLDELYDEAWHYNQRWGSLSEGARKYLWSY